MVFVPRVREDGTIDLEVASEVSEPDFAAGVELFGFNVPAFITRRVDTDVSLGRLPDGTGAWEVFDALAPGGTGPQPTPGGPNGGPARPKILEAELRPGTPTSTDTVTVSALAGAVARVAAASPGRRLVPCGCKKTTRLLSSEPFGLVSVTKEIRRHLFVSL